MNEVGEKEDNDRQWTVNNSKMEKSFWTELV